MTAFGRAKTEGETKDITIEIKSVNSRFFDCSVKIPRVYSFLEERIKSYVQKNAVARAKVDVYVTLDVKTSTGGAVKLDTDLADSYVSALKELRDRFSLKDDISVMSVAANRDLFIYEKAEEDLESDWEAIRATLDEAIKGYSEMREAEGRKIEADIRGKLSLVSEYTDEVERISREDNVGYRDKLEARLRQILADNSVAIDENRLLTECAVWADKIAIDEELVRLRSHFGAFDDIIKLKDPSGRKLDFLMQELNRETNTIGSKANDTEISHLVIEAKGELEKIREQVQNFE
jgi:uncharacterized protein (TIGR00255 family)